MIRRFLLSATAVALLAGTAGAAEYKLVNLASQTGTYSFVGVPLSNGLRLATEQINASGMLGPGNSIKLLHDDTASDRNQSITMVTRYGDDKDTLLVFGPTSTPELMAAGPVAKAKNLPQMTNSPSPALLGISDRIFRISVATNQYMTTLANYAADKVGVKDCAYLTVNDNEGYLLQRNIVKEVLGKKGGKIVSDDTMKSSETDFSALSTKIVSLKPECVHLNMPAAMSANVIIQLKQAGLPNAVKIFTSNSAAAKTYIDVGGKAVEGTYLVSEFSPPGSTEAARKFTADYTAKYGNAPDNWAALGYASMQVVAAALKTAGPNPTRDSLRDALLKTKDLPVVAGDGKLTITPDRLTHYEMTVLTVKDGKFVQP
jgi:branched-chain amino acid transport system substrate-binding protein